MAELPQGFWDNLLDYIQDRTVIPVIGPELVTVREGDRDVPLYRWVAERLAADLALPAAELAEGFDLNDVVSLHLRRRGEREELYARIHRMLRNAALTPPEPLRALAGIPGFAFSPDGKRLASASGDRTVVLWDLDLDHLKLRPAARPIGI